MKVYEKERKKRERSLKNLQTAIKCYPREEEEEEEEKKGQKREGFFVLGKLVEKWLRKAIVSLWMFESET